MVNTLIDTPSCKAPLHFPPPKRAGHGDPPPHPRGCTQAFRGPGLYRHHRGGHRTRSGSIDRDRLLDFRHQAECSLPACRDGGARRREIDPPDGETAAAGSPSTDRPACTGTPFRGRYAEDHGTRQPLVRNHGHRGRLRTRDRGAPGQMVVAIIGPSCRAGRHAEHAALRWCSGSSAGRPGVPCTSPQRRRSTAGAGGSALQCQAAGSRACAQDRDLPRGARRGGAAQFNEEASRPGGARPVLVMTASTFIGEPQRLQRSASTSYTLARSRAHAARDSLVQTDCWAESSAGVASAPRACCCSHPPGARRTSQGFRLHVPRDRASRRLLRNRLPA